MKKVLFLGVILTLLTVSPLFAHDTWVAQEGDALAVMWGHDGKSDPYKPTFVKNVKAFDAAGQDVGVTIKPEETRAVLAPAKATALVALLFETGAWVKTPEGYKNVSKREAKDVLESWKGSAHNKNIWQWHDNFAKPLGYKFEIVPLKNPLTLKVGESLPVQVIYDGKPKEGLEVKAGGGHADQKGVITDKDGKANVTINQGGMQVIKTSLRTPLQNDPDADLLRESTNIVFQIK